MTDLPTQVCGHRTRHTSRIGCCPSCHRLFSSDSAFNHHRRAGSCVDPVVLGMVQRRSPSAADELMWSLPGGAHWGQR